MGRLLRLIAEVFAVIAIAGLLAWQASTVLAPIRVAGRSMSPALTPGDIVLVRLGRRPIVGDIVLVRAGGHAQMLHRAVRLLDGGAVRTRGDSNPIDDLEPAQSREVAGVGVCVIPLGTWLARWRARAGYATMTFQPNSTRR